MGFDALEHIDEVRVGIDVVQHAGDQKALTLRSPGGAVTTQYGSSLRLQSVFIAAGPTERSILNLAWHVH